MTKLLAIRIIKLLSALETAGMMHNNRLPEHLHEDIATVIEELTEELLK